MKPVYLHYRGIKDFRLAVSKANDAHEKHISEFLDEKPVEMSEKIFLSRLCFVLDQGQLGSCVLNATAACIAQSQKINVPDPNTRKVPLLPSRLFMYYLYRTIYTAYVGQDTGSNPGEVLNILKNYGSCVESDYPYDINVFEKIPTELAFKNQGHIKIKNFYRIDKQHVPPADVHNDIKKSLMNNHSVIFCITCFDTLNLEEVLDSSYRNTGNGYPDVLGCIPFPAEHENAEGGHCILIVGFDDKKVITNLLDGSTTTGAYIIQNSWGTSWGVSSDYINGKSTNPVTDQYGNPDGGFGFVPYEYVLKSNYENNENNMYSGLVYVIDGLID